MSSLVGARKGVDLPEETCAVGDFWLAVREFKSNYHILETILFTTYPYSEKLK